MIKLNSLNCHIKFGIELEFYTEEIEIEKEHLFLSNIKNRIASLGFLCEKESFIHQYEIKGGCYIDPDKLIDHFELVKELIIETAQKLGGSALFKAKPYLNRAGSALNVHVNLLDLNHNNLFYRSKQKYSDYLIYSIGGLCTMLKEHMLFFAPNDDSYLRFQYSDIYTPTTVSWGVNNRTTAIRIVNSGNDKCRLEHRVPGADCSLERVLGAITEGIAFGVENKIAPPNRVYGVASDSQYKMDSLI